MYTTIVAILFFSVFFALLIKGNYNYFKLMKTPPVLFWAVWVIYNYINWKMIGLVNADNTILFILNNFVYPIITMSIIYFEGRKDLRRTTLFVLFSLSLYVVLGMLIGDRGVSQADIIDPNRGGNRLGNMLPLTACIMAFFSIMAYAKGWINKKWVFVLLTITLVPIFLGATRKAIGGWGLIVAMSFFTRFNLNRPADFFKVLFLIIALYLSYTYIMEDTYLGERLMTTEEQGEDSNDTGIKGLNYLGDRATYYILGWELFLEHPINGIGLRNFQIVADFPFVIHSEYIVQICECGLIGTILFILFMGSMIACIVKMSKTNSRLFFVCIGGILCMLFLNFTAWTYNGNAFFAMYGLILAVCYHEKKKKQLGIAIPYRNCNTLL